LYYGCHDYYKINYSFLNFIIEIVKKKHTHTHIYIYIYIYRAGIYIGSPRLQIAIGSPSQSSHLTHYGADMRTGGGPLGDPTNRTHKILGQTAQKVFYSDNV